MPASQVTSLALGSVPASLVAIPAPGSVLALSHVPPPGFRPIPPGKIPFANSNGKQEISDGSDTQFAKLEKELTLEQNSKSQVSTTSSEGEHREGTCRAQFQEQKG
jgi:hypothetical protein